jgi:hypothetical protein
MIGLGLLLNAWQGISGFWQACNSIVGLWVPAAIAAVKINTNSFFVIIFLVIMVISILYASVQMYRILSNSFIEILARILNQNTSTQNIIFSSDIRRQIWRDGLFVGIQWEQLRISAKFLV